MSMVCVCVCPCAAPKSCHLHGCMQVNWLRLIGASQERVQVYWMEWCAWRRFTWWKPCRSNEEVDHGDCCHGGELHIYK